MGLRIFSKWVWEATCRVMGEGFGGASEKQQVQPLGILRQCHVGRCYVTFSVFSLDKSSLKTGGLVYRPGSRK